MENERKRRDIELVKTEKRRNYLVSEPNYHTTKFSIENLLVIEMKRRQIFMNKPVYLSLSMLEMGKIVMYKFWNDFAKPNYGEKSKLCNMDTDIVYIKTDEIYKDIAEDIESRFDTSNCQLDRPFPEGKNKTIIG